MKSKGVKQERTRRHSDSYLPIRGSQWNYIRTQYPQEQKPSTEYYTEIIDRITEFDKTPHGTFPVFTKDGALPGGHGSKFNPLQTDYSTQIRPYAVMTFK